MAQQPNVELDPADLPRETPKPPPPSRWDGSSRPGSILTPAEATWGGPYGTPGPDAGWALRILRHSQIPGLDPLLEAVLVALMAARASRLGRAPVPEDLEAALVLCGLGEGLSASLAERRERWLKTAAHEKAPGRTAVADVEPSLLVDHPDRIRFALAHQK